MTSKHSSEPFWINEPDWLCAVEFLNDEDTEGRDLAADTIGYLLGYARLTNTRSLALLGDPSAETYEIFVLILDSEGKGAISGNGEIERQLRSGLYRHRPPSADLG